MSEPIITRSRIYWSAINNWTSAVLSFAVTIIFARLLTPSDFGLVALAMIVVALGSIIISDTVSSALVQRRVLEDIHLHTAFWGMLVLGTVMYGVIIVFAPIASDFFADPRLAP